MDYVRLKSTLAKLLLLYTALGLGEEIQMKRVSINGALFLFMSRGEKLTEQAIWNESLGPHNRYVLWPRGEFWDVRFKMVENGKLEWLPVADKPFSNESEAWQAAYNHWEKQLSLLNGRPELNVERNSL